MVVDTKQDVVQEQDIVAAFRAQSAGLLDRLGKTERDKEVGRRTQK